jgi:hypothetical protein
VEVLYSECWIPEKGRGRERRRKEMRKGRRGVIVKASGRKKLNFWKIEITSTITVSGGFVF